MSIPLIVTRGYGNGTLTGSIKDIVLSGYSIGAALSAPVFTGTIPTITGLVGQADIATDLTGYFSDATSYSISSVETGWDFTAGTLTVDTDFGEFGPYIVTGTNANGSDSSNEFYVSITFGLPATPSGNSRTFTSANKNRTVTKSNTNRTLSTTNTNRKLQ